MTRHLNTPVGQVIDLIGAIPFIEQHAALLGKVEGHKPGKQDVKDTAMGNQHSGTLPGLARADNGTQQKIHKQQDTDQVNPGQDNRHGPDLLLEEKGLKILFRGIIKTHLHLGHSAKVSQHKQEAQQDNRQRIAGKKIVDPQPERFGCAGHTYCFTLFIRMEAQNVLKLFSSDSTSSLGPVIFTKNATLVPPMSISGIIRPSIL